MLAVIVAAFAGGLILNGMPCVLPIISLKILGLVRHDGGFAAARNEGLAFLAGVMVTMLALAMTLIAIRAGGKAAGWGFQLQSPELVAVLSLVMLGAGLNLAGLFEFGLSAQAIGGTAGSRQGMLGSALSGALAMLVATPCTGPLMAGAVAYALTQPAWASLAIFLALALGFAAPVTVISCFPGLGRWLPRPGAWMAMLKQGLAFPMFAAAAWLAWVLDQQAGHRALGIALVAAVGLGFAAWLYGIGQRRHLLGRRYLPIYGLAALVLGLVTVPLGGIQALPAQVAGGQDRPPAIIADAPVRWSPAALAAARGKRHPVLLAFTASWCITCQVNERGTLASTAVKSAIQRTGTTYMQADSTSYDPAIDDAMTRLGRAGLPLYVVYPADGGKPQLLPQLLSPAQVIHALQAASAARMQDARPG